MSTKLRKHLILSYTDMIKRLAGLRFYENLYYILLTVIYPRHGICNVSTLKR